MNKSKPLHPDYIKDLKGKQFQWIKPINEKTKVGDPVEIVEAKMRSNIAIVKFNDGSKLNADLIKDHLIEIKGNKLELEVISKEVKKETLPIVDHTKVKQLNEGVRSESKNKKTKKFFDFFNSGEIDLDLKIKIKLPNFELIQMMHKNAINKNIFLKELSDYILGNINNKIIKNSLMDKLKVGKGIIKKQENNHE